MIGKIRVVVVDDVEQTRRLISRLLSLIGGVEVVGQAADGVEALQVCRTTHPDCVLMDVNMPRMDGLTAAKALKRELPGLAVVMMSVDDTPGIRSNVRAVGAHGFLLKPLSMDVLASTLGRVCGCEVSVPI